MKLSQISLFLGMSILLMSPVFGQDYSVLVLPDSAINPDQKGLSKEVVLDEILSKEVISGLKKYSKTAPDILVLKNDVQSQNLSKENLKPLIDKYGAKKVLIVGSEIESKTSAQQKAFWQDYGVPIITQPDLNKRVVTSVSLVDVETNKVLWSDVYYKNIVSDSEQTASTDSKSEIEKYYVSLAPKISKDVNDTHELQVLSTVSDEKIKELKAVSNSMKKNSVTKVSLKKSKPEKESKFVKFLESRKSNKKQAEKDTTKKTENDEYIYNPVLSPSEASAAIQCIQLSPGNNFKKYPTKYNTMINEI